MDSQFKVKSKGKKFSKLDLDPERRNKSTTVLEGVELSQMNKLDFEKLEVTSDDPIYTFDRKIQMAEKVIDQFELEVCKAIQELEEIQSRRKKKKERP